MTAEWAFLDSASPLRGSLFRLSREREERVLGDEAILDLGFWI